MAEQVAAPVALLYNKTVEHGILPKEWKMAYVSPIYKKGQRNHAENYRPISLTSILCKVIESFVRETVLIHLLNKKLLSTRQYGFISGRSTTIQLLNYLDKCREIIAEGGVVDAIYFDFKKAFDTVPHRRLMLKLESYGIKGNIRDWIGEFLCGRSQIVTVNGEKSELASVISGIPQGTVLGPILFVVYINGLFDNICSDGYMFADDTKIFRQVSAKEDALNLQADITSLDDWSKTWGLQFNLDKCHVLTIGKFDNIMHTHRYKIYKEEIQHVFEEKDLGVVIDFNLSFEEHIASKIRIANLIVGLIRRSFTFLDCKSFTRLYTAFVRPHLEYAQSVWSPHLAKYIDMIENVQIRATKLVDGLSKMDYPDRLKQLNLPTLVFRRMRGDMLEIFKHFNAYDKAVLSTSFQPRQRPSRKHPFQLILQNPKDGVRGKQTNGFYYRAVKLWNDLPRNVVSAKSINTFKSRLDEAWKNETIKFDHKARTLSDS